MPKIKMLKTACGPQGVFYPDRIYDVEGDLARAFIQDGAAESVSRAKLLKLPGRKGRKREKADNPPSETTTPDGDPKQGDSSPEE